MHIIFAIWLLPSVFTELLYLVLQSYICSALYIEVYAVITAGFHTSKCFCNLKLFSFSAVVTIALNKFKFYCILQLRRQFMCLSRINPSSCLLFRLSRLALHVWWDHVTSCAKIKVTSSAFSLSIGLFLSLYGTLRLKRHNLSLENPS